ncbi:MAG: radical SAM protein [Candidatus Omnitrophica bacterium]|nr:radical SAM protein [Candidatus Omnitrophota bacterium]
MNSLLLRRYDEEGYTLVFNQKTGFFARVEDKNSTEPVYSIHGPELLDISITNYCDRQCDFCYRGSSKMGTAMPFDDYEMILGQAKDCGVLQIALGGGNPNQHIEFERIVRTTREDYNIVPSYTTNGDGLTKNIINISKRFCGAIAISFYTPENEFYDGLNKLIDAGIKTNIHFLLSAHTIKTAIKLLTCDVHKLSGINALIFLLYKPAGRANASGIIRMSQDVEGFFSLIGSSKLRVGFDSCCMPGIVTQLNYNPVTVESCEAGCFSAFISEGLKFYPCSFMENQIDGIDLKKFSMVDAWQKSPAFMRMRDKTISQECMTCDHFSACKGGCTIFKEINLCNNQ